jgi:hypothetical protein
MINMLSNYTILVCTSLLECQMEIGNNQSQGYSDNTTSFASHSNCSKTWSLPICMGEIFWDGTF